MRPVSIVCVAAFVSWVPLCAQARVNLAEIYPSSSCTNFTTRGTLGGSGGEILLEFPESHFSGLGHDFSGSGTSLTGFTHVLQDQNGATAATYNLLVRSGAGGRPSTDAAGVLLQTSSLSLPSGSGTVAWIITYDLATPSAALPVCGTFYHGLSIPPAANWPADGMGCHAALVLASGRADNPANSAAVPNLAWDRAAGARFVNQPSLRTYRVGLRVAAGVLHLGNVDPTWVTGCGNITQGTSYGLGGMWPEVTRRRDGLVCRVRDAAQAQGMFVVFIGSLAGCPGLPLPGLATGALYLHPGSLIPVSTGALDASGEGTAAIAGPGSIPDSVANNLVDFQAATVGPGMTLPVKLTNRAATRFL